MRAQLLRRPVEPAAFISGLPDPPFLLQTANNVEGVPQGLFDGFVQAAAADAPAWMKGFLDNFYNFDTLRGTLVSDQAWQASWNLAVSASATAAVACIPDLASPASAPTSPRSTCPCWSCRETRTVLPLDKTGQRLPALIKDVRAGRHRGRPGRRPWTHANQVNTALLDFIRG